MPIHLISGNDLGSSDNAIEKLIKGIIDPAWSSLNLSRLDGQDISQANQALEEMQSPPFGAGGRVILVKRSPFCNGCSAELTSKFEAAIKHIPEDTHLILNNLNKPDKRLKTTKLIQKLIHNSQATESTFILPAIWDTDGKRLLVKRTAEKLNLRIEEEAITALIEAIGNDSSRLISELGKLALLEESKINSRPKDKGILKISKASVNELIEGMSTNSLEIGTYLLNGNFVEAILRTDALLNEGEPALRIVATLSGQARGWLWVKLLQEVNNQDVAYIAKQAGISNPKRVYVIRKQIEGKSTDFLIELLRRILKIETLLKKGKIPKEAFRDALFEQS